MTHALDETTRTLVSTSLREDGSEHARITVTWRTDEDMYLNAAKAERMSAERLSDPAFGKVERDVNHSVRRFPLGKFIFAIGVFHGEYDRSAINLGRYKVTKNGFKRNGRYLTFGVGGRRHACAMTIEKKE